MKNDEMTVVISGASLQSRRIRQLQKIQTEFFEMVPKWLIELDSSESDDKLRSNKLTDKIQKLIEKHQFNVHVNEVRRFLFGLSTLISKNNDSTLVFRELDRLLQPLLALEKEGEKIRFFAVTSIRMWKDNFMLFGMYENILDLLDKSFVTLSVSVDELRSAMNKHLEVHQWSQTGQTTNTKFVVSILKIARNVNNIRQKLETNVLPDLRSDETIVSNNSGQLKAVVREYAEHYHQQYSEAFEIELKKFEESANRLLMSTVRRLRELKKNVWNEILVDIAILYLCGDLDSTSVSQFI